MDSLYRNLYPVAVHHTATPSHRQSSTTISPVRGGLTTVSATLSSPPSVLATMTPMMKDDCWAWCVVVFGVPWNRRWKQARLPGDYLQRRRRPVQCSYCCCHWDCRPGCP